MSVRMGAPQIFWTCIILLEVAYAGAIGVGLMSPVKPHPHMKWLLHNLDEASFDIFRYVFRYLLPGDQLITRGLHALVS